MGFDYDELTSSEQNDSNWASYSDLFMLLSMVFLLLYVVSSLRGGTMGIQDQIAFQNLQAKYEDAKQQLQVYNTLKEDYLETGATKKEEQVYAELMSQLSLLQDEAGEEKKELRKKATENEQKEAALNKYQQLVRNIVNSNMLAQERIKKRDKRVKRTRERSRKKLASLKTRSQKDIKKLKKESQMIANELLSSSKDLSEIKNELTSAQTKIFKQEKQKSYLVSQLNRSKDRYQAEKEALEEEYEAQRQQEKNEFQAKLSRQKLSTKALKRERDKFKKAMSTAKYKYKQKEQALTGKIAQTSRDLKKAQELANAKKKLARKISKALAKNGIKADVDANTGDVTIKFGDEYFDTGKHQLKNGMKKILEKFIPLYSQTLLTDKKISKNIDSVEIVGFASPTYKGKYVDPKSLDAKDRKAVSYNLDLSYYRARSIFTHIFDTDKLKYKQQKNLLPLVKVTGRSFLADKTKGRDAASTGDVSAKEFCENHNCKKAQRVIIKFNLKE